MAEQSRSPSRGRAAGELHSTGRGGLGNFRSTSSSRPRDGPDDFSSNRGREVSPAQHGEAIYSTGRGGAGNMRSPSRDAHRTTPEAHDTEVLRAARAAELEGPHSFGRGGAGNFTPDRSRSRSANPVDKVGNAANTTSERSRSRVKDFIHKVTHPHSDAHHHKHEADTAVPEGDGTEMFVQPGENRGRAL
ncbi:hypothetical protein C8J56DRAFT_849021 [Mycena floridula]|nr:hypothetical protein C8J56DRAFT_849021 [Mycena floridula]